MIKEERIKGLLEASRDYTREDVERIFARARKMERLSLEEVAALLQLEDQEAIEEMFKIAGQIKSNIYGKRVVMFAPLYISDYCVNSCKYCGYRCKNDFDRKKLSQEEIEIEVEELLKMGHKRLALEAGEDDKNCSIDYIVDSIRTIYGVDYGGEKIRRINVNIAATTVENYRKLKAADIGTYILFQESYHKPSYEYMHERGPKHSYDYHLTAFDRAMEAGIDDVGAGILLGLYDYKYELLSLITHNNHLEERFNVGFHTVSVPRIKPAVGMDLSDFKHIVTDEEFKKIVAIIRIALPFTGIIISTREDKAMRDEVIDYGVSQLSAASSTEVGGYKTHAAETQFKIADGRSMEDVILDLIDDGYIPSFCTACYRMGRTGEDFMDVVNHQKIKEICTPNALLTLYEYSLDHMGPEVQAKVEKIIERESDSLTNGVKPDFMDKIRLLKEGQRDLYY